MNNIKQIAQDYNINPKALKRYVKESGLKPKQASRLQVLEVVYINCTELFYCRSGEIVETVEYLNHSLVRKLIQEMGDLKKGGALWVKSKSHPFYLTI